MQEAFFTPLKMTRTGMIYREEFAADVADRFDLNEKFSRQDATFPGSRGRIDDHKRRRSNGAPR